MFAMYANGWSSALENPIDERDRFQRVALEEARFASERHATDSRRGDSNEILAAVRRFVGLAPAAADCVACPA